MKTYRFIYNPTKPTQEIVYLLGKDPYHASEKVSADRPDLVGKTCRVEEYTIDTGWKQAVIPPR